MSTRQKAVCIIVMMVLITGCSVNSDFERTLREKPFFEVWDEYNGYGVLDVAMDGTVLLFSIPDVTQLDHQKKDHIYLKSSQDGGATWSENRVIGKPLKLDCQALGIGPYDGRRGWEKSWGYAQLGTSVVDENTGEIMFFMTALHPASYMYKSRDHGETWNLEKIEMRKDSKGFLPVPNGASDPGVTIKYGPHKGRLLVPAFVWPHYDRLHDSEIYTTSLYSDDHGKTWIPGGAFTVGGTGEPSLVELSDGTIYFNSRNNTLTGNRWIAYSDDSGETLRDIHEDDELFDGPPDAYGCKAALLRLDYDGRDILLFSSPSPNIPQRHDITVWVSFDGGKTWPHSRLIKKGLGNYTWMTAGRKGTPSEGFIYLLAGKDWMARFNLAWLLGFGPEPGSVEALNVEQRDLVSGNKKLYSQALRTLAGWPNERAAADLYKHAWIAPKQADRNTALKGYIRIAGLKAANLSTEQRMDMLQKAILLASRNKEKKQIISKLESVVNLESLQALQKYMADPSLRDEAQKSALKLIWKLRISNPEEAVTAAEQLAKSDNSSIAEEARKTLDELEKIRAYIMEWMVSETYTGDKNGKGAGVFKTVYPPENGSKEVNWKKLTDGIGEDKISLHGIFGQMKYTGVYVKTTVVSPVEQTVRLEMGSNDGIKAWFNGEQVHSFFKGRGCVPGSDVKTVKLRKGNNEILLKIVNISGVWEFSCRIRQKNGKRVKGLTGLLTRLNIVTLFKPKGKSKQ